MFSLLILSHIIKGEKERYIHLTTEFQRILRRNKKAFLRDQCKEIQENNRVGKTRDLFKKIRDNKGIFHAKMGSIKDRNGMDLTEAPSSPPPRPKRSSPSRAPQTQKISLAHCSFQLLALSPFQKRLAGLNAEESGRREINKMHIDERWEGCPLKEGFECIARKKWRCHMSLQLSPR